MTVQLQSKRKRHYINNRDFYAALVRYQEDLRNDPLKLPPDYIGKCFILLATRISNKSNFSGYSWKDDFIGDALENCVKAIKGFNPEKSNNPFAYFTRVCNNAFIRRIQTEKKEQYIKLKSTQDAFIFSSKIVEGDDGERELYDNNDIYIQEYEASMERKKAKKTKAKKPVRQGLDLLEGE